REAVEPGAGVTLLPYLDGERTPNLPGASGLLHGLRHDTTAGQLLQAAYDGAVHSLLGALGAAAADRRRRPRPGLAGDCTTAVRPRGAGARGQGAGRARRRGAGGGA